jgi:hypothetical protein
MNNASTPQEGSDSPSSMDVDQPYLPGMEQYMRDHIARVLTDARSAGPSAVLTTSSEKSNPSSNEVKTYA